MSTEHKLSTVTTSEGVFGSCSCGSNGAQWFCMYWNALRDDPYAWIYQQHFQHKHVAESIEMVKRDVFISDKLDTMMKEILNGHWEEAGRDHHRADPPGEGSTD